MSEIAECVPKIIKSIFSTYTDPFKELGITIRLLENSRSFWSECYQVTFNSEKPSLFVKIPRISEINAALDPENTEHSLAILKTLTAQETVFYKDFHKIHFPTFPIPRFYYGESLQNEEMAGLVCEDFSRIGASIDFVPGFSDRQVLGLMEALAGFHAKTIQISDQIPWENYGNELYDQKYIRMLYTDTLQFEEICPDSLTGRIQAVKHVFDEDGVNNSNETNEKLGVPFVLCHNDLNTSNVLWNKETGNILAFIDFQHVSKGAVTFDIIRILSLGLSVEDRRANTDRYLTHYYTNFSRNFPAGAPFSYQQLLDSYSAHFNFVNATSLFSLYYYYKMYKDASLGVNEDVKEKEEKAAEIFRRTIGLLEDVKKGQ